MNDGGGAGIQWLPNDDSEDPMLLTRLTLRKTPSRVTSASTLPSFGTRMRPLYAHPPLIPAVRRPSARSTATPVNSQRTSDISLGMTWRTITFAAVPWPLWSSWEAQGTSAELRLAVLVSGAPGGSIYTLGAGLALERSCHG